MTVNAAAAAKLERFLAAGGRVLFYGPARGEWIESLLGLVPASPLDGEFDVIGFGRVRHLARYSGGPLDRVFAPGAGAETVFEYRQDGEARPAVARVAKPEWNGGEALWVRGSNSFSMEKHCHFSTAFDRNVFAPAEAMLRGALAKFGWRIEFDKYSATTPDPRLTLRWHDNALYFSGFGTDTTVTERFRFPDGAPLFTGADALIRNGSACYPAERAVNRECRVFLGMKHGRVSCREQISLMPGVRRRILLRGVANARVVFRPEAGHVDSVRFYPPEQHRTVLEPSVLKARLEYDGVGPKYVLENVTGDFHIAWAEEN